MDMDCIGHFSGQYEYLSNFHLAPLELDGRVFLSAEHAFQAAKSPDPAYIDKIVAAPTPGDAKRLGRRATLIPDWDATERFVAMRRVLEAKFTGDLGQRLLDTGTALLIEGNRHHDDLWGDCECDRHSRWPGRNRLGQLLMQHRATLRGDAAPGTPGYRPDRVMITGHRPQHLSPDQQRWVRDQIARTVAKIQGMGAAVAISGMALGVDTWWAQAALDAGMSLWAYRPCPQQPNRWPRSDQAVWADLCSRAARVVTMGDSYDVRLFHARNEAMIRDSDLTVAVWDSTKTSGGTASAVAKARQLGKSMVLLDPVARTSTVQWASSGSWAY